MDFVKIEPNVWKPEKSGDEITGVLIGKEDSKKYENKVYHLETKVGSLVEQKVVFGTTVLDDRMGYIKVGDTVKIVFKGTVKNSKQQDTKVFEVFKGR
jgi:hypothetical protein